MNVVDSSCWLEYAVDSPIGQAVVSVIENKERLIVPSVIVDICRDPKDNYLLALSPEGDADFLITGGNDLPVLKQFGGTQFAKLTEIERQVKWIK